MRNILLAAVAAAALASPGMARDGSPYVGLEGGYVIGADTDFDIEGEGFEYDDAFEVDYKSGYDLGLIGGYDLGAVRAEAELSYKRLKINEIEISDELIADIGEDVTIEDFDDRVSVLSGMANLLFDLSDSFYVGGGAGVARVKAFEDKDTAFAWQLLAGFRAPVSENVDVGLKYRYFNTGNLDFADDIEGTGVTAGGKLSSHSILASLIFNFGAPAAPAAYVPVAAPAPVIVTPAPQPVATQTCPDGSVIPATSYCPAPAPRAGERG